LAADVNEKERKEIKAYNVLEAHEGWKIGNSTLRPARDIEGTRRRSPDREKTKTTNKEGEIVL